MTILKCDDPLAVVLTKVIRDGDTPALEQMLAQQTDLATVYIADAQHPDFARSLLHIATDWPGHYPNSSAVLRTLVGHGASVQACFVGRHAETALHWAASSDDLVALDALLDLGADIETRGAVIAGGTALADAVAFRQWNAARRLVERGARLTLWQAAALGMNDRLNELLNASPSAEEITNAFWCACLGGQRETAENLLGRGADKNWVGHDGLTPLRVAQRSGATELAAWLLDQGAV